MNLGTAKNSSIDSPRGCSVQSEFSGGYHKDVFDWLKAHITRVRAAWSGFDNQDNRQSQAVIAARVQHVNKLF